MNSLTLFEKTLIAKFLSARDKILFLSLVSKQWRKLVHCGYSWSSLFYQQADKTWNTEFIRKNGLHRFYDFKGISILSLTQDLCDYQFILQHVNELGSIRMDQSCSDKTINRFGANQDLCKKLDFLPRNRTKLHLASRFNHLSIVKDILINGMPKIIDGSLKPPTEDSISIGNIIQLVNAKDDSSIYPIHEAIQANSEQIVELLIKNGADIEKINNYQQTAMYKAVEENKQGVSLLILKHNPNLKCQNQWSQTLIHKAAANGMMSLIKKMFQVLGKSIKINQPDNFKKTPLHHAAQNGQLDAIEFLLQNEADIDAKDMFNDTPLNLAVDQAKYQAAKLLIQKGASYDHQNKEGETVFQQACKSGNLDTIKMLHQLKVDIHKSDKHLETGMHVAIMEGHFEVVKYLVGIGMRIQDKDKNGKDSIKVAELYQREDIVTFLKSF